MKFRSSRKQSGDLSLRQRLRPDQAESRRSVAQTFSYHTQRSDQSTNTGRKFRKDILSPKARSVGSFWLQRFGLAILLAVGLVCLVSALTLSSNVKLEQLGSVNQNQLFHNQAAYQASANTFLHDSILNHNKLTINTDKLSQQLLAKYPELDSATVAVPLISHRPIVYISYTQPAVILHNQSGSFVLDTNGKVLAATSAAAVDLGLPTVTDQSGLNLTLNHQVLTSGDVSFIQTVVAGLQAKQVTSSSMTLPAAANELDVAIAGKPYFVKFNLHATSAKLQIGTFLAVQQRLQGENITPAKYIDVRVDGRAYYQ
jgi:hypothetical protein